MSVVFRELIDRFLEGIPGPLVKYTREGVIRGMVEDGVLYTYRIPLVVMAPQGYIINVRRYAMMSSRDLQEAIKALRGIQKLKFYVDLELLFEAIKKVSAAVKIFVKGTVYHRQHGRMRLGNGKEWHVAVKNTALRSWGATSYD